MKAGIVEEIAFSAKSLVIDILPIGHGLDADFHRSEIERFRATDDGGGSRRRAGPWGRGWWQWSDYPSLWGRSGTILLLRRALPVEKLFAVRGNVEGEEVLDQFIDFAGLELEALRGKPGWAAQGLDLRSLEEEKYAVFSGDEFGVVSSGNRQSKDALADLFEIDFDRLGRFGFLFLGMIGLGGFRFRGVRGRNIRF